MFLPGLESVVDAMMLSGLLPFYVVGGLRFRRWVVADRAGIPRYPPHVETIFLWLLYSSFVSVGIVILKQLMRRLG